MSQWLWDPNAPIGSSNYQDALSLLILFACVAAMLFGCFLLWCLWHVILDPPFSDVPVKAGSADDIASLKAAVAGLERAIAELRAKVETVR